MPESVGFLDSIKPSVPDSSSLDSVIKQFTEKSAESAQRRHAEEDVFQKSQQAQLDKVSKILGMDQGAYDAVQKADKEAADLAAKPPVAQEDNPLKRFGSLASTFAILASMKTRAPLVSALNASGAAMKALKQNDIETYKQQYNIWEKQVEAADKRAKMENDHYKAILENKKLSVDEIYAHLRAAAALHGDKIFDEQIDQDNLKTLVDILGKREDVRQRLAIHNDDMKEREKDRESRERIAREKSPVGGLEGMIFQQKMREFVDKNKRMPTADEQAKMAADVKAADRPLTPAQLHDQEKTAEVAAVLDLGDTTVDQIQGTVAAVGLSGKAGRPLETLGNVLGVMDSTVRRDIESNIETLRATMIRLLNDRSIMTARDHDAAAKMIRGLEYGSTIQNSISSIHGIQNLLAKKYGAALKRYGFTDTEEKPKAEEKPSGPSQADLEYTAKKYNMTVDEVKKELGLE